MKEKICDIIWNDCDLCKLESKEWTFKKNPYLYLIYHPTLFNQEFLDFFTPFYITTILKCKIPFYSSFIQYTFYQHNDAHWNMTENENEKRKPSPESYAERRLWNAFIHSFSSHPPWSGYSIYQKHFASILFHHLNINVLLSMDCELCLASSYIY